ncbi:hypothetical protein KSC_066100 [Ktedonobacter sp. SOSP1-52]|nr:hypothetical protein KSC_066100 [Ktedonobacter sp. SOSP1-52]
MELEGAEEVTLLGPSKDQGTSSEAQGLSPKEQGLNDQGPRGQATDDQGPNAEGQGLSSVDQEAKTRRSPMTTEAIKVYDAYSSLLAKGAKPTASLIQAETGVSLNTAKKYLREIREREAV